MPGWGVTFLPLAGFSHGPIARAVLNEKKKKSSPSPDFGGPKFYKAEKAENFLLSSLAQKKKILALSQKNMDNMWKYALFCCFWWSRRVKKWDFGGQIWIADFGNS